MLKACESLLRWEFRHGTSGLAAHTKSCPVLKRNTSGNYTITSISGFTAVSDRRAISKTDKHDLADVIMEMCTRDIRQFSILEGAGFKLLAEKLISLGAKYGNVDIQDSLPCARTISRHVETVVDKEKQQLKADLKNIWRFAITRYI